MSNNLECELLRKHDLAAVLNMFHDTLLEMANLVPQFGGCAGKLGVLVFEIFHLVLQAGDAFELSPSALAGCYPIPQSLALGLDPLLGLHVDGGQGRGAVAAVEYGDDLWLFRLLLDVGHVRPAVVGDDGGIHR